MGKLLVRIKGQIMVSELLFGYILLIIALHSENKLWFPRETAVFVGLYYISLEWLHIF